MSYDFSKNTVLVVDDDRNMKILLLNILKTLKVRECVTADDGKQGLEVFQRSHPDVVLTDWDMGDHDGLTLTKAIREDDRKNKTLTPVILCSGNTSLGLVKKALDAGVTEYLCKPFSISDIGKRIQYTLSKPRQCIDTEKYYGPDRRRVQSANFQGPDKRKGAQG